MSDDFYYQMALDEAMSAEYEAMLASYGQRRDLNIPAMIGNLAAARQHWRRRGGDSKSTMFLHMAIDDLLLVNDRQ